MNKTCIKCSETKHIDLFVLNKKCLDGYGNVCKKCNYERIKAWGKANPEKIKTKQDKYNSTEKRKLYHTTWNKANPEKIKDKQDKYNRTEKRKLSYASYNATEKRKLTQDRYRSTEKGQKAEAALPQKSKEWKKANKGRVNATNAAYLKRIKQATPPWADQQAILDVYMEAEYFGLEVDHIVPIRSKLVCGLHTWENLQLLTKLENITKGNRVWPDMPTYEPRKDGI